MRRPAAFAAVTRISPAMSPPAFACRFLPPSTVRSQPMKPPRRAAITRPTRGRRAFVFFPTAARPAAASGFGKAGGAPTFWWIGLPAGYRSKRATRRLRAESDGFTLLEVLVAFTIASFLLVVVLRALTLGLDGSQRSEAYTRATILAESTLETMGIVTPLKEGDQAELQNGP